MFFCGWNLGKYAGRKSFFTGITMSILGISLVLITIALGDDHAIFNNSLFINAGCYHSICTANNQ
jgi:hypothetical protein